MGTRVHHVAWLDRRIQGFTLIEILMVVVVLGILGSVALRSLQSGIDRTRIRATQEEMDELVMAIAGNPNLYANGLRSDFGYVGDIGTVPATLDNLMTNPGAYSTWKGPYVSRRFSEDPDGFKKDAWANLYTFSNGITVSSTGGGATSMTKSAASTASDLTSTLVTGTITDAAGNPPGDSSVAITLKITYPDGTGGTTSATTTPNGGGAFSLSGIPVGNHTITAVYRATNDTVWALASSLPKTGAFVNFRLPGNPFAASGGDSASESTIYASIPDQVLGPRQVTAQLDIRNANALRGAIAVLAGIHTHIPGVHGEKTVHDGITIFSRYNPRADRGGWEPFSPSRALASGRWLQSSS